MSGDVPDWAAALLRDGRVGRLATADAAARPLVVPVCYVFDGRHVYSPIDRKPKRAPARPLKRLANITENPRVALVVDEYDEDWSRLRYVIVHGTAHVIVAGPELDGAAGRLEAKYPQYRDLPLDRAGGTMIRITPERIVAWSYS